jgi:hypothetical protein
MECVVNCTDLSLLGDDDDNDDDKDYDDDDDDDDIDKVHAYIMQ